MRHSGMRAHSLCATPRTGALGLLRERNRETDLESNDVMEGGGPPAPVSISTTLGVCVAALVCCAGTLHVCAKFVIPKVS